MCACPSCRALFPAQSLGRAMNLRTGLRLEYFTIAWNFLEAIVGLIAGIAAGSVALVGFALDSVVEGSSGGILLWRLRAEKRGANAESVERRAVRLVAIAFFLLAGYVGFRATVSLVTGSQPEDSPVGIVLAIISLFVMPVLARRKESAARKMDSRALQADSSQTMLCTYLSIVLLAGLLANTYLGWWWADPLAALGIAGLAAKEGRELWTTEELCCA